MFNRKLGLVLSIVSIVMCSSTVYAQNLRYQPIYDQTGQIVGESPLPSGWANDDNLNDTILIRGPQGIVYYDSYKAGYFFTQDPNYQGQTIGNRQFAQPISSEQYLYQVVKPQLESSGYRFITSYPLPEFEQLRQRAVAMLTSVSSQLSFSSTGGDFTAPDGSKVMIVVIGDYAQSPNSTSWGVAISQMEAPTKEFENAKKVIRHAITNTRLSPEAGRRARQAHNNANRKNQAHWDNVTRDSAINHQRRMDEIRAVGERSRDFANTSLSISESSHESFLRRQAQSWESQADTIRSIRGERLVTAPTTNETYTVQSGSNYYWINQNNGEYISSDNPNYNPNQDDSLNVGEWILGQDPN